MNVMTLIGFVTTVVVYWVAGHNLNAARVGSKSYGRKVTVLALGLITIVLDHAHPWKPLLEPIEWVFIDLAFLVLAVTTGNLYAGSKDHPRAMEEPPD